MNHRIKPYKVWYSNYAGVSIVNALVWKWKWLWINSSSGTMWIQSSLECMDANAISSKKHKRWRWQMQQLRAKCSIDAYGTLINGQLMNNSTAFCLIMQNKRQKLHHKVENMRGLLYSAFTSDNGWVPNCASPNLCNLDRCWKPIHADVNKLPSRCMITQHWKSRVFWMPTSAALSAAEFGTSSAIISVVTELASRQTSAFDERDIKIKKHRTVLYVFTRGPFH